VTDLKEPLLLLSLRPRFADAILDGSKTVELRRQRMAIRPGTMIFLYASAPVMSVVGAARLAGIRVGKPEEVWRDFHSHLALSYMEFDNYLTGATQATALQLTQAQSLRGHSGTA
jgi:predicted transcriptional regulator